jgi:N-acetylglucosamine-6-phosphate deacetylase
VSRLLAGMLAMAGVAAPGWVKVDGERFAGTGHGPPPCVPDERLDGILAPGLCDLQVNGAAGHEVTDGAAALDTIDAVQLAHGVTSYLPTLVSPHDAAAERVLEELGRRALDPASPVAGVHVEGPFLSPSHAGMHPVERLRVPSEGVPAWLDHPAVRMVTLAPELPGALQLIEQLRARGVAVALGHSGASAEDARTAIDAGAGFVTHVFNAMAPLHHREPGLAGVALVDERVHVGVIADGLHLHPLVLELVRRAAGDRAVLVSDASPAAGAEPGRYEMAGVAIERGSDGAVRTDDGRLAGSALTLDEAVRNWTAITGATVAQALLAATEAPALAAGVAGGLRRGAPAHLVLLGAGAAVRRVMFRGRWMDQ